MRSTSIRRSLAQAIKTTRKQGNHHYVFGAAVAISAGLVTSRQNFISLDEVKDKKKQEIDAFIDKSLDVPKHRTIAEQKITIDRNLDAEDIEGALYPPKVTIIVVFAIILFDYLRSSKGLCVGEQSSDAYESAHVGTL